MADKKIKTIKTINWLCLVLSALALILECMPKSIELKYTIQPGEYMYSYWSYFGNPFDPTFFMAWVVIICTITTLLLNILSLFKDKRVVCIASLVLQSIAAAMGVLLFSTVYSAFVFIICAAQVITLNLKLMIAYADKLSQRLSSKIFLAVFSFITLVGSIGILYVANAFGVLNVIIAVMAVILFLLQFIRHCIVLKGDNRALNKKISAINWISLASITVALFLQTISNSIKDWYIEQWFGEETVVSYDTSYFAGTGDWSVIFTMLIVASTIIALLFAIITMIVDKKSICIATLVFGALMAVSNLVLIIRYWRFVTAYMIIIMILFIINVITLSIKLRMDAWNKKIIQSIWKNAPI